MSDASVEPHVSSVKRTPKTVTTLPRLSKWTSVGVKLGVNSGSPYINEMLNTWLPSGHEKALKLAFYNTIALIFFAVVLFVMTFVYHIFESFVKSLLWALLCGSALHPFKKKTLSYSQKWIKDLKQNQIPITVGTVLLPFWIINNILDNTSTFIRRYFKLIAIIVISSILFYAYINYLTFINMLCYEFVVKISYYIVLVLSILSDEMNTIYIITTVIAYLIIVSFFWDDRYKIIHTIISPCIWIALFINTLPLMGCIGYLISIFLVIIILMGILKTIIDAQSRSDNSDQTDSVSAITVRMISFIYLIGPYIRSLFKVTNADTNNSNEEESVNNSETVNNELEEYSNRPNISAVGSPIPTSNQSISLLPSADEFDNLNKKRFSLSNAYLYSLLWAFFLMQLWFHLKLLYLLFIPLIFILIKLLWSYMSSLLNDRIMDVNDFIKKRDNAFFQPYLKNAYYYFLMGDNLVTNIIEMSLNSITSMSVIFIMIVCILMATVFMAIQIYGESIYLVNIMGNVVNNTIGDNTNLNNYFNGSENVLGAHGVIDEIVKNTYEYGRKYIKDTIRSALNVDGNFTKTKIVEKQILELWDRAYHLWKSRNSNETDSGEIEKTPYDIDKLLTALKTLNFSLCFDFLKQNIDTVISILDSIYNLLKGNITLLFSAIAAVISILFGGGTALLDLCLKFIVFTTALFYLLSASGEQYKPIEFVNRIFPSESSQENGTYGGKFGKAVEEAINGVFAASLKISAFYGLYTYLIHRLFEVNIVYIPTLLAAIFGAVPFLGAYWASFPAILELLFVHQQTSKALIMLVSALLPVFFIDSTIYSEIKSAGHPYLTGLAIAGGLFYLGFEGALFGPMLLCCLFVAFNIYSSIMQENSTTTPLH